MHRLYLDTCSWINLLFKENLSAKEFLLDAIKSGKIEILYSHAINDEIKTDISGVEKRLVPAGCFVWNYSRLDAARLGDPDGVYTLLTADIPDKVKNRRAVWDAIHYATAHVEKVDLFVTDDGPLTRKIAQRVKNPRPTLTLHQAIAFLKKELMCGA